MISDYMAKLSSLYGLFCTMISDLAGQSYVYISDYMAKPWSLYQIMWPMISDLAGQSCIIHIRTTLHIGHHIMYISAIIGLDSTFASDNHGQYCLHILNSLANALLSYQVFMAQLVFKHIR